MTIARPGPRLLHSSPLGFVRKRQKNGSRPVTAALSLTSMIDFLVVSVVFLLITFSTSPEGAAAQVKTPDALHTLEMIDAPLVTVDKGVIVLDGRGVGTTRVVTEQNRIERLEGLQASLEAKRDLWKQTHPGRPFPGAVILQIDQDTPSIVVKSVFQSAARAGYPNVSFMVNEGAPVDG